jgi:hypothetical protein
MIDRLPEDFKFALSKSESENLRPQFATSIWAKEKKTGYGK